MRKRHRKTETGSCPTSAHEAVELVPRSPGEGLRRFQPGRWYPPAALLLIAALAAVLYGGTLSFPFVFDDWGYLIDNPFAFDPHSLGCWFDARNFTSAPSRIGLDPDLAVNIMLRPFAYFTFYLNHLAGGVDPWGYRLVNVILHAANGCLVFLIFRHLFLHSARRAASPESSALFVPLAVALLFVAHPLQIESVTYVIQRFTSMGGFFYLLTFWLHFRANLVEGRIGRWLLRSCSIAAMILGMLTKESVVTVPVMIVLADWLVMGSAFKVSVRRAIPLLICMGVAPALVLFTTWAQNDGHLTLGAAFNLANRDDVPRLHYDYFLTSLKVIMSYLRLLLVPMNLNLDPKVEWSQSIFDWRVLLSIAGITGIMAGAWMIFRRWTGDARASMILVFAVWYFVTLSISSGLVPLPDAMAEHRTYVPIIGAIAVLVCVLDMLRTRFCERGIARIVPATVAVIALAALSWATLARNNVWSSRVKLWSDVVSKSPTKWRPLSNLAASYAEEAGQLEEAEACYRKVLTMEPRARHMHENLAIVLIHRKEYAAARDVCLNAIALGIDSVEVHYNLGLALCNLGRIEDGAKKLSLALERRSGFRPGHIALGQVYAHLRRYELALEHFRRAASIGPEDAALTQVILQIERQGRN